jgi:ribonucleoside-diphosphate reductase alpha chain
MPTDRHGKTHKVHIEGMAGYVTANTWEDGSLREVFVHGFGKLGSTIQGWTDSFSILTSIALQEGVSLSDLARRFAYLKFEPYGMTDNPKIPKCYSVPDYIFRWLALEFGDEKLQKELDNIAKEMGRD